MSGSNTISYQGAYFHESEPTMYFSGFFQANPRSFHSSAEVEIDIMRTSEDVSVAIQDITAGYRSNTANIYTNKGFIPPVHKEMVPLNSHELLKRMPGKTPFENPDFRSDILIRTFNAMRPIENKIRRAVELQSSEIFQTGRVNLLDNEGSTVYAIDYKPKATHFPISTPGWATATFNQKMDDLSSLAKIIRTNGLRKVDEITMGGAAFENFIRTDGFKDRFDTNRANTGMITPMQRRGDGGIFRGVLEIENEKLDVFTYDGRYTDPQTKVSLEYMRPGKIVMRASSARQIATWGNIPNIGQLLGVGQQIMPGVLGRFSSSGRNMDLHSNMWLSPNGEDLHVGVGARPLMVPQHIDSFGCLDTGL